MIAYPLVGLDGGWCVWGLNVTFLCYGKESFLSLPCGEQQNRQTSFFTRYFIIKHIDSTSNNSFKSTSPFLIAKNFQSVLGEVYSIRKLKSGDLLVEVSTAAQSNIHSRSTKIGFFFQFLLKHIKYLILDVM